MKGIMRYLVKERRTRLELPEKKSHFITGQPQNAKNANVNFHKRYKPEMVWTSDPTGFDPMVFDPVTPPDLNC